MEFSLLKFVTGMVLPPASLILLAVIGLIVASYRRRLGTAIIMAALGMLYVFSTPLCALALMSMLQPWPALDEYALDKAGAEAIVILAGGRRNNAAEFGGDTVNDLSLVRIRYGVWLQRRTGLPLLLTGGKTRENYLRSEAELMKDVLVYEYALPVKYVEAKSKTTYENALYSAEILKTENIQRIYLVTHAWHMPRAVAAFEHFGLTVIPAPTAFYDASTGPFELDDIIPESRALHATSYAIHEIAGHWWYRLRYY